jgi:hypothetical protein
MELFTGRRALARLTEDGAKPAASLSLAALERDLGTLAKDDENASPLALLSPVGAPRASGLSAPARSPRPNRSPPPPRPRDARRQSTAIFAGFERSAFGGAGLLGDAELAMGVDEEMVLPLARDAAGAAGAAAGAAALSLFVDVDVGELPLGADLPAEPATARGASALAAPARCASPARAAPRAAPPPAAGRDSAALLSGLARACAAGAPALDDDADGAAPQPAAAAARPPPAAASPAPRPPSRLRPPSASTSYFSSATRHAPAAR